MRKSQSRKYTRGTYSYKPTKGDGLYISGDKEFIDSLRKFGIDLDYYAEQALENCGKIVRGDMKAVIDRHHQKHRARDPEYVGNPTGTSLRTFKEQGADKKEGDGHHTRTVGFMTKVNGSNLRISKDDPTILHGLPTLFIDIGTRNEYGSPHVKPTFFVYYAFKDNEDKIRGEMNRVLSETLKRYESHKSVHMKYRPVQ